MTELKASLCYGNDSPGVTSPTPKPFEAIYPPSDLSEVVASLRRELNDMDRLAQEQAAEITALREAVRCASGALPPEKYPYWHGLPCVVRALCGKEWSVGGSELP